MTLIPGDERRPHNMKVASESFRIGLRQSDEQLMLPSMEFLARCDDVPRCDDVAFIADEKSGAQGRLMNWTAAELLSLRLAEVHRP